MKHVRRIGGVFALIALVAFITSLTVAEEPVKQGDSPQNCQKVEGKTCPKAENESCCPMSKSCQDKSETCADCPLKTAEAVKGCQKAVNNSEASGACCKNGMGKTATAGETVGQKQMGQKKCGGNASATTNQCPFKTGNTPVESDETSS